MSKITKHLFASFSPMRFFSPDDTTNIFMQKLWRFGSRVRERERLKVEAEKRFECERNCSLKFSPRRFMVALFFVL
jgi:hypothetical protein